MVDLDTVHDTEHDYYLNVDMVIVENGIGLPKADLTKLTGY